MAGVHRRLGPRGVRAESDPVLFEELRVAEQVAALAQERDSLKSRLSAARARVDSLLERLPENNPPKDAP